jgi:C-terminal processing protease CtpA/Prc
MIGDKCFVVQIDKDSGADKSGLQVGDQVLGLEGYEVRREDVWKLKYLYYSLRPQGGLNVLAVKPDGKTVRYAVPAKITEGKKITDLTGADVNSYVRELENSYRRRTRQYYFDKVDGLFIWKMPSCSVDPNFVDDMIDRAKKSRAMVIDLRGNGGGRVDMVMRLIANVFDHDVKVADEKRRKETKEQVAKTRGKNVYGGKIAVLIDSESASASEVFARVLQLENRGQVFGDRSAGAVMESMFIGQQWGMDRVVPFGTSVTVADLIMKDGKSLEKIGVTPDVRIIPTGLDLATRRDVVLAKALDSLGFRIPAESAGKIFPVDDGEDN